MERAKSAARPYVAGGELGGGTLAAKIANRPGGERESPAVDANSNQEAPPQADTVGQQSGAGIFDAEEPRWPTEDEENAYAGGEGAENMDFGSAGNEADDDLADSREELTPLDSLVERIPDEVRNVLEELYRARFITVRKMPRKTLSN